LFVCHIDLLSSISSCLIADAATGCEKSHEKSEVRHCPIVDDGTLRKVYVGRFDYFVEEIMSVTV
jgi:hypothetical protein